MGSIYKRGKTYWIQFYINGKPYRESTKSESIGHAKRLLEKREREKEMGFIPTDSPGVYSNWIEDRIVYKDENGQSIQQPLEPVPFAQWLGRPCIYLLMWNKECVYIGQSTCLADRLQTHIRDFNKKFNRVFYFEVSKHLLDKTEKDMIADLKPKYNLKGIKNRHKNKHNQRKCKKGANHDNG